MNRPKTSYAFPVAIVLAMLVLISCTPPTMTPEATKTPQLTMISPLELRQWLEAKDFVMINVHIPFEGEISGTDAHIPYNEIAEHVDLLPVDKQAKIVLYCKSGGMVIPAADTLMSMGYTNLYDLEGGFEAWKAAGYELSMQQP